MNQIAGVEQALNPAPREPQTKPAHDFAHELAREQARNDASTTRATVADRNEKLAQQESETPLPNAAEVAGEKAVTAGNVLEATTAAARESTLQTVAPVGVTEAFLGARVYGLHLAAQGYLSVLSSAQVEEQSHATEASVAALEIRQATAENGDIQVKAVTAPSVEGESNAQPGAMALQLDPLVVSESEAPSVEPVGLASATSTIVWPERVVRIARGSHGVSVWLRDYRIGSDEGSQLVSAVIAQARAHGEPLQRIILNGREVWTSRSIETQGIEHVG